MNHRQARAGGLYAWEFAKEGRELRVRVEGRLTFSSSLATVDAAISGYGIAYIPEDLVTGHLAAGRLTQALDDWSPLWTGYHLYYPSRRQMSPAMAMIVDALRYRPGPPHALVTFLQQGVRIPSRPLGDQPFGEDPRHNLTPKRGDDRAKGRGRIMRPVPSAPRAPNGNVAACPCARSGPAPIGAFAHLLGV
jgi:hypothetical protein